MTIASLLGAIVIGAVIGALGRLVLPGKQDIGIVLNIVVGIVAALIGTFIVGSLQNTKGLDWIEILVQVVLAAIGIAIVAGIKGGGRNRAVR